MPRDPEGTLKKVEQRRTIRVGLVENAPWVIRSGDQPLGVEPQLVRDLAASLGAAPEWHWGSEQEHMEALETYDLDLVIGGLESNTPWSKKIGLTRREAPEGGQARAVPLNEPYVPQHLAPPLADELVLNEALPASATKTALRSIMWHPSLPKVLAMTIPQEARSRRSTLRHDEFLHQGSGNSGR